MHASPQALPASQTLQHCDARMHSAFSAACDSCVGPISEKHAKSVETAAERRSSERMRDSRRIRVPSARMNLCPIFECIRGDLHASSRRSSGSIRALAIVCHAASVFGCSGTTQHSGESGPSPEQLIDRYCADQCGEFASEAECQTGVRESRTDAIADGCVSEFDTNLRCVTSHDPMCSQAMAEDCAPLHQAFEDCLRGSTGPDCALDMPGLPDANGLYSCRYDCDAPFGSQCTSIALGGPFDCACTTGPNVGASFSVADCGDAVVAATTTTCQ